MAYIIHKKLIEKQGQGYSVHDSKGNFLGAFKDKDYAFHRLFQVEDRREGQKELQELKEQHKLRK